MASSWEALSWNVRHSGSHLGLSLLAYALALFAIAQLRKYRFRRDSLGLPDRADETEEVENREEP